MIQVGIVNYENKFKTWILCHDISIRQLYLAKIMEYFEKIALWMDDPKLAMFPIAALGRMF